MSDRIYKSYFTQITLSADSNLTTAPEITVGRDGYVALQVLIDDGAGGAPTDTPIGVWELHCAAGPSARFTQVTGTTITTELAKVAASGNVKVDGWVILIGVPGSKFKLRFKRTSGGAGNSRATVDVSTW